EDAGQGFKRADDRALAAQPRAANAAGRPPAAAQRSARERIDRAGRGSGGVHLSGRGVSAARRESARTGGTAAGQAAQRPGGEDRTGVLARVHQVRESGGGFGGGGGIRFHAKTQR